MTIRNGDSVFEASFRTITASGIRDVSSETLCKGRELAMFSLPGCSARDSTIVGDGEVHGLEGDKTAFRHAGSSAACVPGGLDGPGGAGAPGRSAP